MVSETNSVADLDSVYHVLAVDSIAVTATESEIVQGMGLRLATNSIIATERVSVVEIAPGRVILMEVTLNVTGAKTSMALELGNHGQYQHKHTIFR